MSLRPCPWLGEVVTAGVPECLGTDQSWSVVPVLVVPELLARSSVLITRGGSLADVNLRDYGKERRFLQNIAVSTPP